MIKFPCRSITFFFIADRYAIPFLRSIIYGCTWSASFPFSWCWVGFPISKIWPQSRPGQYASCSPALGSPCILYCTIFRPWRTAGRWESLKNCHSSSAPYCILAPLLLWWVLHNNEKNLYFFLHFLLGSYLFFWLKQPLAIVTAYIPTYCHWINK